MKRIDLFVCVLLMCVFAGKAQEPVRIAVVPDIQSFFHPRLKLDSEQLHKVFDWIKDEKNGVDFMVQVGDLTEDNDKKAWKKVKDLFLSLDGSIPYTFALGNHDIGSRPGKTADTRNTEMANKYIGFSSLSLRGIISSYPEGKIDNLAQSFHVKGSDFLILSLEFGPRKEVIQWAEKLIVKHPNHKVIINTHAYMYSDNTRIGEGDKWNPHTYGLQNDGEAFYDGEELWNTLIKKHNNIVMVVSGHILNDGVGTLVSTGDKGNKVAQMLANYQYSVKDMGEGEEAFIRIINYCPNDNKLEVETYSPIVDKYLIDDANRFSIELNE